MRLTWASVTPLLCAAGLAAAATPVGHVYLFDADRTTSSTPAPRPVSPETARLIFAQRLALSQYHSLHGQDEEALQHINSFGGRPQRLLGLDEDPQLRAMVVVEGVDRPEDVLLPKSDLVSFTIQGAPPVSANSRLVADLTTQADHHVKQYSDPTSAVARVCSAAADAKTLPYITSSSKNGRIFVHAKSLVEIAKKQGVSSAAYSDAVAALRQTLDSLLQAAAEESTSLTIVLMPTGKDSNSKSSVNPYGSYTLPNSAKTRRAAPEAPLTGGRPTPKLSGTPNTLHPLANTSAPLRGILPACFASQSACESATNNCTGHGRCSLKYKNKDDNGKACYSCMCNIPDIRTNPDGTKKTTRYGGPACQKKDVVMPFWLLAGFSVGLMFVVSWGIGLLYSMGEEELPSVIGAGVSGVRPK